MVLHPKEVLRHLAAAVEKFADVEIESTEQVERLFYDEVKKIARGVKFQVIEPEQVGYRKNQKIVRTWLRELSRLDPSIPRRTDDKAQQLRRKLSATLQRLTFETTVDFSDPADAQLRLYPVRFGVETACYLVIAAALEHGSALRVTQCATPKCERFRIAKVGIRGPKHEHCAIHSEQRSHRRRR